MLSVYSCIFVRASMTCRTETMRSCPRAPAVAPHPQAELIGRQILASDRTVFLTFANAFDLLSLFRSVASGYDPQLCGDVTSKASQATLNKPGFGVNMLGSSFAPLSYTLMPAECESAYAYREAYHHTKAAVCHVISLPSCGPVRQGGLCHVHVHQWTQAA